MDIITTVAPVTTTIADTQKNGFVLASCLFQSLSSLRVPIHGIMGVLLKIGADFMD